MTSVSNLRAQYDRPQSSQSEQQQQAARQQAALRGAQLAFPRPSTQSSAQHEQPAARNSASLVAGRLAQANAPLPPPPPPKPSSISSASLGAVRAHQRSREALHLEPHRLSISGESSIFKGPRSESPSNVAAVLAAARFSPQITNSPKQNRLPLHSAPRSHLRPLTPEQIPEEDQVPAQGTVNEVRQWLQGLGADEEDTPQPPHNRELQTPDWSATPPKVRPRLSLDTAPPPFDAPRIAAHVVQQPEIISPKPVRSISVTESLEAKSKRASAAQSRSFELSRKASRGDRPRSDDATPPSAYYDAEESPTLAPSPFTAAHALPERGRSVRSPQKHRHQKPEVPKPRRLQRPHNVEEEHINEQRQFERGASPRSKPPEAGHGILEPIQGGPYPSRLNRDYAVLTPSISVPKRDQSEPKPLAGPPIVARKVTPHLTGDSLANAIVAGSLASSRAPSPTKSPGPGFHTKHAERHRLSLPFMSRDGDLRTPSPAKGMRQTMRRKPSSSGEDEEQSPRKSSRRFLIRKHPHKHHEGDRKRWRNEMTARERKRYEGLWAANRGHYVEASATNASDNVAGVVVRDIWRRSRLPDHVLEEVWELVDTEKTGWLGRAEFVVGLWLIDQRLKGRKLPVRVQPTVWRSARGIHGLKIKGVK